MLKFKLKTTWDKMKKFMNYFLAIALSFFMLSAFAQTPASVADVKTQMLSEMTKDGYLSTKMANEVANKYITPEDVNSKITISLNNANVVSTK